MSQEIESKQQILERRKEIEQELMDVFKEIKSDFTLDHVRDVIFHEEDNDDIMKVVAMFDRGGAAGPTFERAVGIYESNGVKL